METGILAVLQALTAIGVVAIAVLSFAAFSYFRRRLHEEREAHQAELRRIREAREEGTKLAAEALKLVEIREKYEQQAERFEKFTAAKQQAEREVGPLLVELKSEKGLSRLHLVKKLGDRGASAAGAIEYLAELFRDRSPAVRVHVLMALQRIDCEAAKKIVVAQGLQDDNAGIKAYSAFLAGQLGIEGSKERLLALVRDDGEKRCVRDNAHWALRQLVVDAALIPPPTNQIYAYVLLKAPTITDLEVFNRLKGLPKTDRLGIVEAGVIQGPYDALLEVTAPDIGQFHDFIMNSVQGQDWVTLTRTFTVISKPPYLHWVRKPSLELGKGNTLATSWVLVRVPALQSGGVVVCLEDVEAVTEAATLYGEADIIFKIQALSEELKDIAMSEVRKIPFISETETYRVITPVEKYMFERHSEFHLDPELYI